METAVSQDLNSSSIRSIPARRISSESNSTRFPSSENTEDKDLERDIQRQENQLLQKLRARDREVRAHEAAHQAAGGQYVRGGASFTYQRGPDGRSYAIGGEVQIDASPIPNDPEATLQKAEQVRRAALAPAEPSAQDQRVASSASQMAARARIDIAVERREEVQQARQERQEETAQEPAGNRNSINAFNDIEGSTESSFSQFA